MRSERWLALSFAAAGMIATLSAQPSKPSFEVVSVKRRAEPLVLTTFRNPNLTKGAVFSMPSATAASLIEFAYEIRDFRMVDAPDWIRRDLFEVQARAAREVPADEMRLMVQSLLEDRFKLVVRREAREMPHFALVFARTDGRPGPGLHQRDDCRNAATRPPRPTVPAGATQSGGCGPMTSIADWASRWARLPVIDRTGAAGTFDFFMFASPEDAPVPTFAAGAVNRPPADPSLPSFRDALRDQLGLRLEAVRDPLDVLAVVSVQPPTEN